jgi:hypothetical protein
MNRRIAYTIMFSPFLLVACGRPAARAGAPPDAIPPQTTIAPSVMTAGFAMGVLRQSVQLDGFRVTTHPVTVGNYWRCVDAAVCSAPSLTDGQCRLSAAGVDGATFAGDPDLADLPVTCVAPAQAREYCAWVGGRLPNVNEWLLSARGPDVRRYAWGDTPPSCDQVQRISYFESVPNACCGARCGTTDAAHVGRHPAGESPTGVQDILLTRAELVTADQGHFSIGCTDPETACTVLGTAAGAIDAVGTAPSDDQEVPRPPSSAYGFRCVWSGGSQ